MKRATALRRELPAAFRIPYRVQVSPEVVRTEAGDYVQVFRLSGASFESVDDEVLNNWHERLNVLWRNVAATNIALWVHVIRRRESLAAKPAKDLSFAARLEAKYRERLSTQTLMVNELYLSIVYRPIAGTTPNLLSRVVNRTSREGYARELVDALEACEKLRQTIGSSLARYEPEPQRVYERAGRRYSQVLEFFGRLANGEGRAVPLPRAPLNEALATTRPIFGSEAIEYRLPSRTRYGAMLGIKEYATPTTVGMYNGLLSAPLECVLTQSFAFLSKATGQGLLQRQHHQLKNAGDFAVSQADELKDALDDLTSNEFVMGDHHFSIQVIADELPQLNDQVALARAILADATGLTLAREDMAVEAAFWAQFPGCFSLRPRKAPITSRNFAAMMPFHNFPTGRATGNHWGDAIVPFMTTARSPYFFSLHASDPKEADGGNRKDTGHTLICGPTGSGKTVLIGFLISLLMPRGVTQMLFDKDRGLEILTRALGGEYRPLGKGESTGFNPLQLPPTPENYEFQKSLLRLLVRGEKPITAREQADLDQALRGTLALEPHARRLSRLIEFTDPTEPEGIHARLAPWCASTGGDYAWVFDNEADLIAPKLKGYPLCGFDLTHFLDHEILRAPVNKYLLHLVQQVMDGRQLVCWLEEFSKTLRDPDFQSFADDGTKTARKRNSALVFIIQVISELLASPIGRGVVQQMATKIIFPNPDALAEDYIEGLGLSEREYKLIKEILEPGSGLFLIKQGNNSVVALLDLRQGFEGAIKVISGRTSTVDEMYRIIDRVGPDPAQWLPLFEASAAKGAHHV